VYKESQEKVPIRTGRLIRSGEWRRLKGGKVYQVRYDAPYSIYVHERVDLHHDQGQAKFLEQPFKKIVDDAEEYYINHLKRIL